MSLKILVSKIQISNDPIKVPGNVSPITRRSILGCVLITKFREPQERLETQKIILEVLTKPKMYISIMFQLTRPVAQLLGLAGLTPQHPDTYITAWRNRQALRDEEMRRTNAVIREEKVEEAGR